MTDNTEPRTRATEVASIDRRTMLAGTATTGAVFLAGCGAFDDVGDDGDDGRSTDDDVDQLDDPDNDADDQTDDSADDQTDDSADDQTDDSADDQTDDSADDQTDDSADDQTDDDADDQTDDGTGDSDDDGTDASDDDGADDTDDGADDSDDDGTADPADDDADDEDDDGDDDPPGEPTITLTTSPDETAEIGPLDPVEVTADATDPGGNLAAIVWYEGRNHTEIDRDPVSGESGSVTRTFDDAPEWIAKGYPTMAYALTEDGRESEFDTSEGPTVRVPLEVTITGTNSPVTAGERLTVTATIENTGDMQLLGPTEQTFSLVVGDGEEPVDSTTVDLVWAESTEIELGYETYPVESDTSFTVRVEGEDFADETTAEVVVDD